MDEELIPLCKSEFKKNTYRFDTNIFYYKDVEVVYISREGVKFLVTWEPKISDVETFVVEMKKKPQDFKNEKGAVVEPYLTYFPQKNNIRKSYNQQCFFHDVESVTNDANKMLLGAHTKPENVKPTHRGKKGRDRKQRENENKVRNEICIKCNQVAKMDILKFRCKCRLYNEETRSMPPIVRLHVACIRVRINVEGVI